MSAPAPPPPPLSLPPAPPPPTINASVTVPLFGIVYEPGPGVEVKVSVVDEGARDKPIGN